MKLTIYSGSPRGSKGNSDVFANLLADGLNDSANVKKYYTKNLKEHDEMTTQDTDGYFIVFPLYSDAMPYALKALFEKMEDNKHVYKDKPIWFFIHSGFPEAKQSRLLERYLKYFCKIIGARCLGVVIMGGSEGVRKLNNKSKRKKRIVQEFNSLADDILNTRDFSNESLEYFRGMETLPKQAVSIMKNTPIMSIAFNIMLIRKGTYRIRRNKPYA